MTLRIYFGKMNSTLGSVVPLAMFFNLLVPRVDAIFLIIGVNSDSHESFGHSCVWNGAKISGLVKPSRTQGTSCKIFVFALVYLKIG